MSSTEFDYLVKRQNFKTIQKIKSIVEAVRVCMFNTRLSIAPLSTRPMHVTKIDETGCLWFFSKKTSAKNHQIMIDSRVQLFFSDVINQGFLSIYGDAEVIIDTEKIDELWEPALEIWFPKGITKDGLSLIKVSPRETYYWDDKNTEWYHLED